MYNQYNIGNISGEDEQTVECIVFITDMPQTAVCHQKITVRIVLINKKKICRLPSPGFNPLIWFYPLGPRINLSRVGRLGQGTFRFYASLCYYNSRDRFSSPQGVIPHAARENPYVIDLEKSLKSKCLTRKNKSYYINFKHKNKSYMP